MEEPALKTKFPFSHYGVARRWFWWVALPLLDLILVASAWSDWTPEGPGSGFATDVAMLVFANTFLPLMAMGDRLSPKVAFDWEARRLSVPKIGSLQSLGLGFQQPAQVLPFADIRAPSSFTPSASGTKTSPSTARSSRS